MKRFLFALLAVAILGSLTGQAIGTLKAGRRQAARYTELRSRVDKLNMLCDIPGCNRTVYELDLDKISELCIEHVSNNSAILGRN